MSGAKKVGPHRRKSKEARKRERQKKRVRSRPRKVWKLFEGNYESSCKGKVQHEFEQEAKNHALELRARGDRSPLLTWYPCAYCGKWHVGHK